MNGVVGYRAWQLDYKTERLLPAVLHSAPAWEAEGKTQAGCARQWRWAAALQHPSEEAPVPFCACGLYAHPDFASLQYHADTWASVGFIGGAVLCWGTIIAHGDGRGMEVFRSQFAKPILLLQSSLVQTQPIVNRIAGRLGAGVVSTGRQLMAQTRDWKHIKEAVNWKPAPYVPEPMYYEWPTTTSPYLTANTRYIIRYTTSTGE